MDIFFADPDAVPLPPEEMEILMLEIAPYPEGKRVGLRFQITPFQKRPNIEVTLFNPAGRIVSQLSVVEAMEARMDFTMHIRESQPQGEYRARMRLFYADLDSYVPPEGADPDPSRILDETDRTVATREISFQLGNPAE
ncbi:MAG: hypothetical protein HYZ26_06480 [Chloroflexi bacterium]|nr:hypothetical protein [Chloroflexota bacterium]